MVAPSSTSSSTTSRNSITSGRITSGNLVTTENAQATDSTTGSEGETSESEGFKLVLSAVVLFISALVV